MRWKEDQRPKRYGWAPGSYLNHCHGIGCKDLEDSTFIGDKRAIMCADCAYALPDEQDKEGTVTPSCGCVFCDIGLDPDPIRGHQVKEMWIECPLSQRKLP
jgi:hypothetical protein